MCGEDDKDKMEETESQCGIH